MIRFSENLIRLRKEHKLTQSQVADYLNVTKASVSKWETGQTAPDFPLLPLLAALYGVTLDTLVGYEPMLTKQQIQKVYKDYTDRFSQEPFRDVFVDVRKDIKTYYSCYPFLFQMAVLLLNHCDPVSCGEDIEEVRELIFTLCERVETKSSDHNLCEGVHSLGIYVMLQAGKYEEVIAELSDLTDPDRMPAEASLLITAQMATGKVKEAENTALITLYQTILKAVSYSMQLLTLYSSDFEKLNTTITRTDELIEIYDLVHLHPNTAAAYYYHSACALLNRLAVAPKDEVLKSAILDRLGNYSRAIVQLFRDNLQIHGDEYFTCIDEWIASSALGDVSVRSKKEVLSTALDSFDQPFLQSLGTERLTKMKEDLKKECEKCLHLKTS